MDAILNVYNIIALCSLISIILLNHMVKDESRPAFIAFNHYGHPKETAQFFPLLNSIPEKNNGKKKVTKKKHIY